MISFHGKDLPMELDVEDLELLRSGIWLIYSTIILSIWCYRFMPKSILSGHFLNDSSFADTYALLSFIEHGWVFPDSSDNVIFDMWNMKLALPGLECSYWNCKIIYGIMSNRTLYPLSFLVTCWWWDCCCPCPSYPWSFGNECSDECLWPHPTLYRFEVVWEV